MIIESLIVATVFGRPMLVVVHGREPTKVNLTSPLSQQQRALEEGKQDVHKEAQGDKWRRGPKLMKMNVEQQQPTKHVIMLTMGMGNS